MCGCAQKRAERAALREQKMLAKQEAQKQAAAQQQSLTAAVQK
jgi:hypothetical protein